MISAMVRMYTHQYVIWNFFRQCNENNESIDTNLIISLTKPKVFSLGIPLIQSQTLHISSHNPNTYPLLLYLCPRLKLYQP